MTRHKFALGLLVASFVAGVAFIAATTGVTQSQGQAMKNSTSPKSDDDTPTVDFDLQEPEGQLERERRIKRGKKYETGSSLEKLKGLNGLMEDPDIHNLETAFPVEKSDVIVQGTVIDSKAFLSRDKSAVYSEFQLNVNRIFKNDNNLSIAVESNIVAERMGGNVRFSSGEVLRRGEDGRNLPHRNSEYVFFLKWDELGEDFLIITGYQILGGKVVPLDGYANRNSRVYANYEAYRNVEFPIFIAKLQESIAKTIKEK